MPIPFSQKLKRISKVVKLETSLPKDRNWMAWWYCGLIKNRIDNTQPLAYVGFRELLNNNHLSDEVKLQAIPLTALGQVRLGTIWQNNLCQAEAIRQAETFSVNFTRPNWRFTSFGLSANEGVAPPYPVDIYPLAYAKDKNWLLEFKLPEGGRLLVPCLEFFTRCYGRSAELRRVLATYSWEECVNSRLYAPLGEPEEPPKWKVRLRKRLVNADVVLLAHAKYDSHTRFAVKNIYAELEAHYKSYGEKIGFIKIAPWFEGPADIRVKGIWFDNGKSFLAFQVVGCSDPSGNSILRGRENANNAQTPAPDGSPTAWAGMPPRILVKPPQIIQLASTNEPDPHAISVEIEDPEFEVLGTPRTVITMQKDQAVSSAGPKGDGTDASAFSSGDPSSKNQGIGYAAIHAKPVMESLGMVRDMWNAILRLKEMFSDHVQSVEWFTFEDGYRSDAEPKLIGLKPFSENDVIDTTTRKWPYMDVNTLQTVRGVLIARIVVQHKPIYILEIQRRPQQKKNKSGEIEDAEESYQGLVFLLDDQSMFLDWLRHLLSEIRLVKGVVRKLVSHCPGKASAFKHSTASSDQMPCESALLNALGKMDINFSN